MKRSITTLAFGVALAVGCASTPVSPARVASTEAAVKSAREAGAANVPEANAHLKKAEEQLKDAKNLMAGHGKTEEVEALLSRSKSDAALAAALSDEAKAKTAPTPSR